MNKCVLDAENRPSCPLCGETIDTRPECSCGHIQMHRLLPGRFSDYDIMDALGFGSNPQETHHNPAAWKACNAWRAVNAHFVDYEDGYEVYEWNNKKMTHASWCGYGSFDHFCTCGAEMEKQQ